MRARFETASNYAAFIHDAMSRPSEGGRFYAQLAHIRCMEAGSAKLDAAVPSVAHPARQAEALRFAAALQERCAGVAEQFPDTATFWRALKHSNARGTPDQLLMIPLMASSQSGGEDLRRAQELGDPYLLAATLEVNVEQVAESIDPAYAEGRNREVLFTAAGAAACEIVGDCRDNWRLKFFCAVGGHCEFDDYRDFARAGLAPGQRPLFDTTLKALVKRAGH